MITRPEESYRLCCVVVCDLETSRMGAPYIYIYIYIYDISSLKVNNCFIAWLLLFIVSLGTNGCVNICVNSPEDGPVGPKNVKIRQYINKIEIVTSVVFYSIRIWNLHSYVTTDLHWIWIVLNSEYAHSVTSKNKKRLLRPIDLG